MVNINQKNMIWAGGGLLAFMLSGKLGPLKTIAKIGGLAAAGVGVADMLGIFSISQVPILGAYATDNTMLMYDPNNYYLPPRDSSIMP